MPFDSINWPSNRDQDRKRVRLHPGVLQMQDVFELNTGLPDMTNGEARDKYERLRNQSVRLADRLKALGVDLYDNEADMKLVGNLSTCIADSTVFKASRFLPIVAARDRRPHANALTYWLEALGGDHVRYAVFTSGTRVPWHGDLRGRMAELKKQVRRWAKAAKKRYEAEVLFIGVEYTVSPAGIHLHANVLYRLLHWLPKREWEEFLQWTGAFYPHEWQESGELKNVAEIVKYMVKPDSLERDYVGDDRLLWLYKETIHARYMTPAASFKAWWSAFDRHHKALWVGQSQMGDDGRRHVVTSLAQVEKAAREKGVRQPSPPVADEFGNVIAGQPPRVRGENVIVARIAPMSAFTDYKEPVSMVAGLTLSPKTEKGLAGLMRLCRQILEAAEWSAENKFRASLAAEPPAAQPPISLDNSSLKCTVQNDKATEKKTEKLPIRVESGTKVINTICGVVIYDAKQEDPAFFDWIDRRRARREGRLTAQERATAINNMFVRRALDGEGRELDWHEQIRRFDAAHRPPGPPSPPSPAEIAAIEAKRAEKAVADEAARIEFAVEQERLWGLFLPKFAALLAYRDADRAAMKVAA